LSKANNWRLLLSGLFIVWVFGVFGLFYVIQKPFGPEAALAVFRSLLDLLAAGWIGLLGVGVGQRLLRPLEASPGESLIVGGGLGLGALGLLTLGLGLAGLLDVRLFWGLSLVLTLLLRPDLRRLSRWRPVWPGWPTGLYLAVVGFFTLFTALLPPADWDGLFYHLTAPKLFIQAGQIRPGFDVPHFNFPFLAEMLFTYSMLLRGDIAAKLLHTLYGLLLVGLVYLTTGHHLSRKAAWPALLILLSMPMVTTLAGWAYNDLALAFYQLAALYGLLNYRAAGDKRWLVVSGALAGLAMGLKYTSFVGPLVIGLLLLWEIGRKRESLRALAYFGGPAVLVALPWYIKNFFFTGNPFYPFLFHGLYWDEFRAAWYAQAGTGIGFEPLTLLQLPALLTFGLRDANYFDGRTGPLFLLFLPLMLLYGVLRYRARGEGVRPSALDLLLLFALAQFLVWTWGVIWSRSLWQSRLLLPALVALSPAVGWLWTDLAHLDWPRFSLYRFINLIVGLALALNLVELSLGFVATNPLAFVVGQESRDENLTRRLGAYYATMERLNNTLPPDAVVLFLWEPRSYYCRLDCRPDSILDQLAHDHHRYGDAAAIVAAWKRAGITHVLLYRQGLEVIKNEGIEATDHPAIAQLEVMEARYFEPIFDVVGAYEVYALR
jgi:4-amino-4-deoxy-L-arabinose transferase-like glycosyltransferase